MGNYAQLLGRVDKIKSARRVASQAYEYAHQLLKSKNDAKTIEDTANAELRFARLLRARPGAKRRKARKIALDAQDRLQDVKTPPSKRSRRIQKGLASLLKELRSP